tara:strand:+ start:733 stop:1665 length:933 start_codon:yes stop_codon:yes gene_type:complete
MLNIIQLLDDEGLGHCVRMVTFAKKISSRPSKVLILVSKKRIDQLHIITSENLDFVAYDTSSDINTLYSLILDLHPEQKIESWSIDSKKNCKEIIGYLIKNKVYVRLFDNVQPCRLLADENIFPTPLFRKDDLDWSTYGGKLYGGAEYVLIREGIRRLKDQFDKDIRKNCVISFGGSDPENLTLKLMMNLSHFLDKVPIVIVVGPGFKNKDSILAFNLSKENKFKIVKEPKNVDYYIASAKLLITALGMTTLEAMFLNISCVCISNKTKDKADLDMLKKFNGVYVLDGFKEINECKRKLERIINSVFSLH